MDPDPNPGGPKHLDPVNPDPDPQHWFGRCTKNICPCKVSYLRLLILFVQVHSTWFNVIDFAASILILGLGLFEVYFISFFNAVRYGISS